MTSRRDFLKSSGCLIVSFSAAGSVLPVLAQRRGGATAASVDARQLDAWIAIAADGSITAHTGKCELGQGMFTAQIQLIAEELSVPVGRVRLVQCDTSVTPDSDLGREQSHFDRLAYLSQSDARRGDARGRERADQPPGPRSDGRGRNHDHAHGGRDRQRRVRCHRRAAARGPVHCRSREGGPPATG